MRLLYIHHTLNTGGIETLIVRSANWLSSRRHEITIFLTDNSTHQLEHLIAPKIRILKARDSEGINYPGRAESDCPELFDREYDCICSFGPGSCVLAGVIMKAMSRKVRFWTGVYHPRAYSLKGRALSIPGRLAQKMLRQYVPRKSVVFMNKQCRDSHAEILGVDFSESQIVPLPVDLEKFGKIERNPRSGHIISVGRLDPFKTYNEYMIDVVHEARKIGIDVTWTIYGDGSLKQPMQRKIRALGLESSIRLAGTVEYEKMGDLFHDAWLFIGMGTALVEAAAAGIPAIMATENAGSDLCRYSYDAPLGCVGERLFDEKNCTAAALVENLFKVAEAGYLTCSRKSRDWAGQYELDTVMKDMESSFSNAETMAPSDLPCNAIVKGAYYYSRLASWRRGNRGCG